MEELNELVLDGATATVLLIEQAGLGPGESMDDTRPPALPPPPSAPPSLWHAWALSSTAARAVVVSRRSIRRLRTQL
eukprot:4830942-Pleurochrysis_carterae.AAC.1